jgi:soluble lytic murein transglycosylase
LPTSFLRVFWWLLLVAAGGLAAGATLAMRVHAQAADALAELRARVVADDVERALQLIAALPAAEAARPELAYLAARLHERRGRLSQALASLPAALPNLPLPVIDDARRRRAQWLARTGDCQQARPLLAELLATQGDADLALAAAQCALEDHAPAEAVQLLRKLGGNVGKRFALRFLLAQALNQSGERDAAVKTFRDLAIDKPEHSRADEIERELNRLGGRLDFDDDERLARAQAYLSARAPQAALTELERVRAPKAKLVRARVLHLRGMALFRLRTRYADAAKLLAQAAALESPSQADDAFHYAQALARSDRDRDAVRAYRAFAKKFPQHKLAMDALHDAAWLELRHELPGGEAHMRAFVAEAEQKAERDVWQSGLWELAFYLFGRGRYTQAIPLLERYAQSAEGSMVRARGLYWAGRAALLSKKPELARQRWHETIAVEPLHWYALLARQRLQQLGAQVAAPFAPAAQGPAPVVAAMPFAPVMIVVPPEVDLYARLGLVDDAVDAMRAHEVEWKKSLPAETALVSLGAAYQRMAEYGRPYRLAEAERAGAIRDAPIGLTRAYWELLFPRPYAADVAAAVRAEKLPDDDFVYAVMRKESAFDPKVVSSADAIGLLQLIEPTARAMASQLGITPWQRGLLYRPSVNIQLGAHYLSNLLSRYRGQAAPAIAAYNAGEHRIGPWLARAARRDKHGRIELDRWVEDIPIDQTRNYVRRVVANWARYKYLANPGAGWPMQLPEHLVR